MISVIKNVAMVDRINAIIAYDTAPVVPMIAPVARFSRRIPVVPAIIIIREVIETDMLIAKSIPNIINFDSG